MKKSYLMIAAAALVFAACSNEKPFNEAPEQESVIGFASYSNKLTRSAAAAKLEDYHTTMAVYGTKATTEGTTITVQRVFENVTCKYTANSTDATGEWFYSPARYWDRQATNYKFIGFAPANAPLKYTMANDSQIDATNNKFESSNTLTIAGYNLQDGGATTALKNTFKGTTDADNDVMIVKNAVKIPAITKNMSAVDLVYNHTLSKLVVGFKKGTKFAGTVKVNSVTVSDYKKVGTFDKDSWTAQGDANLDYKYTGSATELTTSAKYFIESLVMPQDFTAAQKLTVKYTIISGTGEDAYSEDFTYTIPLKYVDANTDAIFANGVNSYDEDTVYTITIIIAPNVIQFDGGVANWTSSVTGSATIE